MAPTTPELKMILDRLEKIERQNRLLRRMLVVGFCLLGSLVLLDQARLDRQVEIAALVMKDAKGAPPARLEARVVEDAARPSERLTPGASVEPAHAPATSTEAGLLVLSALHPLIPKLARVSEKAAAMVQQMRLALAPPARPADASAAGDDASTAQWSSEAPVALDVAGRKASTKASLAAGTTLSLSSTTFPSGSSALGTPVDSTRVSDAPAGLPLIQWNRAWLGARPAEHVTRNPFQFATPLPRLLPPGPAERTRGVVIARASGAPPVAPPVALKALGYTESVGSAPQVILTDDVNVYVVRVGDTFAGRFKVLALGPTEVDIDDRLAHRTLRLAFNP